jgi:hypothetical protein
MGLRILFGKALNQTYLAFNRFFHLKYSIASVSGAGQKYWYVWRHVFRFCCSYDRCLVLGEDGSDFLLHVDS